MGLDEMGLDEMGINGYNSLLIAYPDCGNRNPMGVAHSYCYKSLLQNINLPGSYNAQLPNSKRNYTRPPVCVPG